MSRDFRKDLDELRREQDRLEQLLDATRKTRYHVVDDLLNVRARDIEHCVWCTTEISQPSTGRSRSTCSTACRTALGRWREFARMGFQPWPRLPALPPLDVDLWPLWPMGSTTSRKTVKARAARRVS